MSTSTPPEFLARGSYRIRRLMDAARLLPVFCFVLLILPLMRASPETDAPPTASESVYLFLVWFGSILAVFLISRGLRPALEKRKDDLAKSED